MVYVQFLDAYICVVRCLIDCKVILGIEGDIGCAIQFDTAASLASREIGRVSGTVGLDTAVKRDAVGNADDVAHLRIDEGSDEVQLLGFGIHLDVSLQASEV